MKRSWSWRQCLPHGARLPLRSVTTTPAGVLVDADGATFGRCPGDLIHVVYLRTLLVEVRRYLIALNGGPR